MTLFISQADIETMHEKGIVTMTDYVAAVEAAYRDQGLGEFQILPRQNFWMERGAGEKPGSLKVGGGLLKTVGVMGCSLYSTGYGRPLNLWVTLYSATTGAVEAILQGSVVGRMKTGATAAVAAKYMAKAGAETIGLIGTGAQAKTQLMGLMAVRPLRVLRVFSRAVDKREAFATWARQQFPALSVAPVTSARAAVEGADIVVTVTTSKTPVLEGAWLSPGAHGNFIGAHYPAQREVDTAAIQRGRIVVDDLDQAFGEKGEILIPLEAGEIERDIVLGDIGAVIAGKLVPRRDDRDITMFLSGGTALEYMGASAMLYAKARAAGLGQALAGTE